MGQHIRVFARMTPQGKADVIRALQTQEVKVFMCGDGGNDMGALKQADVGLALFSGYGNMNANADEQGEKKANGDAEGDASEVSNDAVALNKPQMSAEDEL